MNNPKDEELREQLEYALMEGIVGDWPIKYSELGRKKADKVLGLVDALIQDSNKELIERIIEALPKPHEWEVEAEDEWQHAEWVGNNVTLKQVKEILTKMKGE